MSVTPATSASRMLLEDLHAPAEKVTSAVRKGWLLGLAILMGLVYLSYHFLPLLDPPNAVAHVVVASCLFVVYLVAAWLGQRLRPSFLLYSLIGFGLLYRLILLPLDPSMSDDLYRYIWDGKMQSMGVNPYALPPSSSFLEPFKDGHIHPLINHSKLRTIYPPTSQLLFALAYQLHRDGYLGLKLLLFGAELATLLLLGFWLLYMGQPMGRLLWYAWCPLPIFELMLDGHLDGFGPPFLLAVLLAMRFRRPWMTGIFYAFGLLVKPLGMFVGPVMMWQLRWRAFFKTALSAAVILVLLHAPYIKAGTLIVEQLMHYSSHWYFNGPGFLILDIWFVPKFTRTFLALVVLSVAWITPFLRGLSLEQRFLFPLTAYMLTAPTLYPWYLVWIAPWLVMTPRPWLFWFVGSITLAHTVHDTYATTGIWQISPLIYTLEYLPLTVLLIASLRPVRVVCSAWRLRWSDIQ